MDARNNDFDFDFTPIGQAIKKARTAKGMTRDELSRIVDYDPRHLQAIENEGQKPSLELFIQLVTMFGVSVERPDFRTSSLRCSASSSVRRKSICTFLFRIVHFLSLGKSVYLHATHTHNAEQTAEHCADNEK